MPEMSREKVMAVFARDAADWTERMTQEERDAFMAISSGFHHGERQVEVELPVFMLGGSEESRIYTPTNCAPTPTTWPRASATAPRTSCGSRACSPCRS
jgi:hypothetical protein